MCTHTRTNTHTLSWDCFLFLFFASASTISPSFQKSTFKTVSLTCNLTLGLSLYVPDSGQEIVFDMFSQNHGATLNTDYLHSPVPEGLAFPQDQGYFWLASSHKSSFPSPSAHDRGLNINHNSAHKTFVSCDIFLCLSFCISSGFWIIH